jgi:hypothetical protein
MSLRLVLVTIFAFVVTLSLAGGATRAAEAVPPPPTIYYGQINAHVTDPDDGNLHWASEFWTDPITTSSNMGANFSWTVFDVPSWSYTALPNPGFMRGLWTVTPSNVITSGCGFGDADCVVTFKGTSTSQASPESVTVTHTFALPRRLTVTKAGMGGGTVTSAPARIDCGAVCSADFADGTVVMLTPTPANGSSFTSWSGDCSGSGSCVVTMNQARNVTASFAPLPPGGGGGGGSPSRTLDVSVSGAGKVTGPGIDCPPDCSEPIAEGTKITLAAVPDQGHSLESWGGACSGSANTCEVTMDVARQVTATFAEADNAVEVDLLGVRVGRSLIGLRLLRVELESEEQLAIDLVLRRNGKALARKHVEKFKAGHRVVNLAVGDKVKRGKASLSIELEDAAGNERAFSRRVRLPTA